MSPAQPSSSFLGSVFQPRIVFALAVTTAIFTWIMLLIGGTVNPTGSSLACTWYATDLLFPTCNDQAFPEMTGGVLYEHGHRLWGWLVGIFTIFTMVGAWSRPEVAKSTKWWTVFALFMVIAQGALGGLTVVLGLDPYLSTAHLVVGYSYLGLLILLAWRLAPSRSATPHAGTRLPRALIGLTLTLVLLQIVLGGVIRHFGAGMACGSDPVGCGPLGFWPSAEHFQAQVHMLHRLVGYAVAAVVIFTSIRAAADAKAHQRPTIARLAWAPAFFVLVQITLGLLTIMTGTVTAVAFHTAIGGLLLALMFALWAGFGPLGDPRQNQS